MSFYMLQLPGYRKQMPQYELSFGVCLLTFIWHLLIVIIWASQVVLVVKNLPTNEGDARKQVRFLCQEDTLEEGMATDSGILTWRIPMDRGTWRETINGIAKSQTRLKWISTLLLLFSALFGEKNSGFINMESWYQDRIWGKMCELTFRYDETIILVMHLLVMQLRIPRTETWRGGKKKFVYSDVVRIAAWKAQIQSRRWGGGDTHFICISLDHKMREAYKSKIPPGYINCQELGLVLARSKGSC